MHLTLRSLAAVTGVALAMSGWPVSLRAQEGDRAGETQAAVLPREKIPPAPALPPAEAMRTFRLAPGFRIELVAAEPLVRDPIQVLFDPDGRLWVLEMRGFMPNVDGRGEYDIPGVVAVLEDTDGDGRMDRRTEFLDGLVMPRAIGFAGDGLLVAEPPNLWFCRDTNGDGKADEKKLVAADYAPQADPKLGAKANPEHASNGLLPAMDNWIYSANHTTRFRHANGEWRREPTAFRGQWGISQDDTGRLYFNANEDPLRAEVIPSRYLARNPNLTRATGANLQLYTDKTVWPVRVNPGVNRGYRPGQLRPDGRLATFTAACAPVVYRGDQFPASMRGDVFVCEPSGNLVRQYRLTPQGAGVQATNAWRDIEVLASTDERFRPVNLANGPDGALYIVDMYRGIIQHRVYVTTYLRNQMLDRGLEQPTGMGRIYRLVAEGAARTPAARLAAASTADLVTTLSRRNGWSRDTAQRLLVERGGTNALAALGDLASTGDHSAARIHALWTLEGLRALNAPLLAAAALDADPAVQATALQLGERFLTNSAPMLTALLNSAADPSQRVRLQAALSLGETRDPRAWGALKQLATKDADDPLIREAIVSGLGGRELEFAGEMMSTTLDAPGAKPLLAMLARCVATEARPGRLLQLTEVAAGLSPERISLTAAVLQSVLDTVPRQSKEPGAAGVKPARLSAEPKALQRLAADPSAPDTARKAATGLLEALVWPGKPGHTAEVVVPLTADEQKRFEAGSEMYLIACAACHQPNGLGQEGLAPPLADSDWVTGPEGRPIRIVLHGLHGPVTVKGRTYQLDMPALGVLDDDQIAAVLTYIRRAWDHTASPVAPETVKKVRAETDSRDEAWSEAELLRVP